MRMTRPTLATALIAGAALLALGPSAAAQAKVKVTILGWSTQAAATTPQVKNNATITNCLDIGNGQRSLYVIHRAGTAPSARSRSTASGTRRSSSSRRSSRAAR